MTKVEDTIRTPLPVPPRGLPIITVSQIDLTEPELKVLAAAYDLLERYVAKHPLPRGAFCNLILAKSERVSLIAADETLGFASLIAVCNIHKYRQNQTNSQLYLLLIILEEVCHVLYLTLDEHAVKWIVRDIVSQDYPQFSLHDIYPTMFDKNNFPI